MVKIEAVLHPEEAELIWTMLNHAAAQLTREPGAAANLEPSNAIACPVAASAESREVAVAPAEAARPAVAVQYANVDGHPTGASAESARAGLETRSLLDRLLDEADALRAAERTPYQALGRRWRDQSGQCSIALLIAPSLCP